MSWSIPEVNISQQGEPQPQPSGTAQGSPQVTAPAETPPPAEASEQAPSPKSPHLMRRIVAVLAVVGVVGLGVFFALPSSTGTSRALSLPFAGSEAQAKGFAAASPEDLTVSGATDLAQEDMAQASELYSRNGSYKGLEVADGGRVVVSRDTALFSRSYQGGCLVYAVVSGAPTKVGDDPSLNSCTAAGMRSAKAELKRMQP